MFWCVFRCKRSLKRLYSIHSLGPGSYRRGIILLDLFTRSRMLQRRLQFTRPSYSIKATSDEAADSTTRPSYSIHYSKHLLDQGWPSLQDLLSYQSVFGILLCNSAIFLSKAIGPLAYPWMICWMSCLISGSLAVGACCGCWVNPGGGFCCW